MHRRTLLTAATSLVLAAAALHPPAEASTAADPAAEHVSFTQWASAARVDLVTSGFDVLDVQGVTCGDIV